jgi:hypothetical protein
MIESNAVQMCACKMSTVACATIDVCRRAVEAVEADCWKHVRLEVSSGVYFHLSLMSRKHVQEILSEIAYLVHSFRLCVTLPDGVFYKLSRKIKDVSE